MRVNSLERAGPESYPTFWDDFHAPTALDEDAAEDAYTTFMNLVEDDGVAEVTMDDE
jgi:hypothetical protein